MHLRLDEAISSELIARSRPARSTSRSSSTPTSWRRSPARSCSTTSMDDPLHLAVPRDHPLADADEVRMADLANETGSRPRPVCAEPLRIAAHAAGFEPKICFESAQWLGKQGLVAVGAG